MKRLTRLTVLTVLTVSACFGAWGQNKLGDTEIRKPSDSSVYMTWNESQLGMKLYDAVKLLLGTDSDYQIRFDSASGDLLITDGTNTLESLSDEGTTANRVISGDLAVNGGDITSTGNLTLTPNSGAGTVTLTTPAVVVSGANGTYDFGNGTGSQYVRIKGAAGSLRSYWIMSNGSARWYFGTDATAESGANAGSNFQITAYNDAGSFLGNAIIVARPTLNVSMVGNLNLASGKVYQINGTQIAASDLSDGANIAHINAAETLSANWVNTANPWADNEVADALTVSGGTVNNSVIGGSTPAAGTFTNLTSNTVLRSSTVTTFTANDTSPTVAAGNVFVVPGTWTTSNDITAFDDGAAGQRITIIGGDTDCNVVDGANLKLSANWNADPDDTLVLISNGTNWYEESRSAN